MYLPVIVRNLISSALLGLVRSNPGADCAKALPAPVTGLAGPVPFLGIATPVL
jgi:hypothetical protein